jgi:hypothetical protein
MFRRKAYANKVSRDSTPTTNFLWSTSAPRQGLFLSRFSSNLMIKASVASDLIFTRNLLRTKISNGVNFFNISLYLYKELQKNKTSKGKVVLDLLNHIQKNRFMIATSLKKCES